MSTTLLLTIPEAAGELRMSQGYVKEQIRFGNLRVLKLGTRVRIERAVLKTFDPANHPPAWRPEKRPPITAPGPGVYFLFSPTLKRIKIGCSVNLPDRIAAMQAASAEELDLVAILRTKHVHKAETWFHRKFASARVRFEWFAIDKGQAESAIREWEALWNPSAY